MSYLFLLCQNCSSSIFGYLVRSFNFFEVVGHSSRSVVCAFHLQSIQRSTLVSGIFFCGKVLPSDSRRASCQLMAKECALSTGNLAVSMMLTQEHCG